MGAPTPKDAADLGADAKKLEATLQGRQPTQLDAAKFDEEVAVCQAAAAAGRRQEALDGLLGLEKQARVAEDVAATRTAVTALLSVRFPLLLFVCMGEGRDAECGRCGWACGDASRADGTSALAAAAGLRPTASLNRTRPPSLASRQHQPSRSCTRRATGRSWAST